jgi:hypothetical protein
MIIAIMIASSIGASKMGKRVGYEWCVEVYENSNTDTADIIDHTFDDCLSNLPWILQANELHVLIRTTEDGHRCWAYVDESKMLPKYFSIPEADGKHHETAILVPQRFHREIARVACGFQS